MSADSSFELSKILVVAESAARSAGAVLREMWTARDFRENSREKHDVKLAADVASEQVIFAAIRDARPEDGILGEESGATAVRNDGLWIVDPLDGTVNFSHGHPHFCTSIAWCWQGQPMLGVVYDPLRDELFSAMRGRGAKLNDAPIAVSPVSGLDSAIVAVGFGKSPELGIAQSLARLSQAVQKLRISGSAALDLAYSACGRLDGYCEAKIYAWDLTAGLLILAEAGGGSNVWRWGEKYQRECVAGTDIVREGLIELLGLDAGKCLGAVLDADENG